MKFIVVFHLSWFFFHHNKADISNKIKICSLSSASLDIYWVYHRIYITLQFFLLAFSLFQKKCRTWCAAFINTINWIYHLNGYEGYVWFEGGSGQLRHRAGLEYSQWCISAWCTPLVRALWTPLQLSAQLTDAGEVKQLEQDQGTQRFSPGPWCRAGKTQPERHAFGRGEENFREKPLSMRSCSALNILI